MNPRPQDITARFLFPLPNDNTIRNLNVTVGGHAVMEPNASGEYEWRSVMHPGEQWEAIVRYHVIGARTWQYGLGSQRGARTVLPTGRHDRRSRHLSARQPCSRPKSAATPSAGI